MCYKGARGAKGAETKPFSVVASQPIKRLSFLMMLAERYRPVTLDHPPRRAGAKFGRQAKSGQGECTALIGVYVSEWPRFGREPAIMEGVGADCARNGARVGTV